MLPKTKAIVSLQNRLNLNRDPSDGEGNGAIVSLQNRLNLNFETCKGGEMHEL